MNEMINVESKRLGKRPRLGDHRTLRLAQFLSLDKIPATFNMWRGRAPFRPRTYGNDREGCCTKASQAHAASRFERLETGATIAISDEEVHRVYREGCVRHYGDDRDLGMYEIDALSDFRDADTTFRDSRGHAITIDAFTAINPQHADEVRAAIATSGKWGIKLCLNLPAAWSGIEPPRVWDAPTAALRGGPEWAPGSWGGHSMFADAYDRVGVRLVHTWYEGGDDRNAWPLDEQWLTWAGLAAYCDEAYWLLQSIDAWRQKPAAEQGAIDVAGIRKAVNKVSSCKIK